MISSMKGSALISISLIYVSDFQHMNLVCCMISYGFVGLYVRNLCGILKWTSPLRASRTIQVSSDGFKSRSLVRSGENMQYSWKTSLLQMPKGSFGNRFLKITFAWSDL